MNGITLSEADKDYLIRFVEEVLVTCANDDVGVTLGLSDMAHSAGQILGLDNLYMDNLE